VDDSLDYAKPKHPISSHSCRVSLLVYLGGSLCALSKTVEPDFEKASMSLDFEWTIISYS